MYIYHAELLFLFYIKRPMGHIAHLRNQFKPINTFAQSIKFIILLIRIIRRITNCLFFWDTNGPFCKTLSLLNPRILVPSFVENGLLVLNKRFINLVTYFHYFVIIFPWKRISSFIWTNLNYALCQVLLKLALSFCRRF